MYCNYFFYSSFFYLTLIAQKKIKGSFQLCDSATLPVSFQYPARLEVNFAYLSPLFRFSVLTLRCLKIHTPLRCQRMLHPSRPSPILLLQLSPRLTTTVTHFLMILYSFNQRLTFSPLFLCIRALTPFPVMTPAANLHSAPVWGPSRRFRWLRGKQGR